VCLLDLKHSVSDKLIHYPNDIDRSLNEDAVDKIRKYRADYNNNPPTSIYFMSAIARVCLGGYIVNLCVFYFYKRFRSSASVFYQWILVKTTALRITLNIDGAPVAS
jgi:hypothetical protein